MPSGDTACQQVLPTSGDLSEQGTQPTGGREGHEIPGGVRWPPSRPAPPGGPAPPWAPALPASTRVASPGGTQRPQSQRPHGSLGVWRLSPRWEGWPGLVDPRLNLAGHRLSPRVEGLRALSPDPSFPGHPPGP